MSRSREKQIDTEELPFFRNIFFQNTIVLLCNSPVRKQCLSFSFSLFPFILSPFSFLFFPQRLNWSERQPSVSQEALNFCQFVCMTMYEGWQSDDSTALRKGQVQWHDLSPVTFLFLCCWLV